MKKTLVLLMTVCFSSFFAGCAVVNCVRYRLAPPSGPASSGPTSSKPLDRVNTESLIAKANEIAMTSFPRKLDGNAKASGKILIITRSETNTVGVLGFNYVGDDYSKSDLDLFRLKKEDLALVR